MPATGSSRSNFAHAYWTPAQLVAHHTVNGCNLRDGDLFGTGTLSGPRPEQAGSIFELTEGGKRPIALSNGESRVFLEDGDSIILQGLVPARRASAASASASAAARCFRRGRGRERRQDRQRRRGRRPDPQRQHGRDRRLRRHRLRRGDRDRARGAAPLRRPGPAGEPHPVLCRRPGRRPHARPQPPGPSRAGEARHRRPLGAGAEAAEARGRQPDRGLQPAAGRDRAPVSRHRRRQARPPQPDRPRHLRRSAPRRRPAQRQERRRAGDADAGRRQGIPLLQGVPDRRRASSAARPPIPTATSRWSARR